MYLALVLLGLLPSFAWLAFYLEEDLHPEPRRLIFLTFLAGAAVTVIVFAAQLAWNAGVEFLEFSSRGLAALFGLAAIEELFKFGAAYFVVARSRAFDEPVDAMIYLIVAALGFAAVENIGALDTTVDAFRSANGDTGVALVSRVFETTTLRFIGATLLHALSSAIVGFYWAKGILRGRSARFLLAGILIATGLHALFNYFILRFDEVIYATLFLVVIAFFVLNDFEKLKATTQGEAAPKTN
ncbi:MAG: PrsW family intramembrane metalloprotease [Candidatus Liptonbacteria bacterium]|nr:PrsW family intramembrane metalloprotease [Candidatus Liptonbacteria bacterium]